MTAIARGGGGGGGGRGVLGRRGDGGGGASLSPSDSAGIKRCSSRSHRITNKRLGENSWEQILAVSPRGHRGQQRHWGGVWGCGGVEDGSFVYKMDMIAVVVLNAGSFSVSSLSLSSIEAKPF